MGAVGVEGEMHRRVDDAQVVVGEVIAEPLGGHETLVGHASNVTGYRRPMTTTPIEPSPDPEVVPSGDPGGIPTPDPMPGTMPGEDPGGLPPEPQTEPAPV
ncbi:hypothetical protein GCM10027026_07780 [Myroides odoratimimus subsp. xuanwuensis]